MANNTEANTQTLPEAIGGVRVKMSKLRRAGVYAKLSVTPEVIMLTAKKSGALAPIEIVVQPDDAVVDLEALDTRLGIQQTAIELLENSVSVAKMIGDGTMEANAMAYIEPVVMMNGDVYTGQ